MPTHNLTRRYTHEKSLSHTHTHSQAMRPPRVVFPVSDLATCTALPARVTASGVGVLLGGEDAKLRAAEGGPPPTLHPWPDSGPTLGMQRRLLQNRPPQAHVGSPMPFRAAGCVPTPLSRPQARLAAPCLTRAALPMPGTPASAPAGPHRRMRCKRRQPQQARPPHTPPPRRHPQRAARRGAPQARQHPCRPVWRPAQAAVAGEHVRGSPPTLRLVCCAAWAALLPADMVSVLRPGCRHSS